MAALKHQFEDTVSLLAGQKDKALIKVSAKIKSVRTVTCCNKPLESQIANVAIAPTINPAGKLNAEVEFWHLNQAFSHLDLAQGRASSTKKAADSQFQHLSETNGEPSHVEAVIRSNLNFFVRAGAPAFSGVAYSTMEQFQHSPGMFSVMTMRLLQSTMAKHALSGVPLIHIHKAGNAPKTVSDVRYIQHYLKNHRAGHPGVLSRVTLYRGAPYLISVISREANETIRLAHDVTSKPEGLPVPTSRFLASPCYTC